MQKLKTPIVIESSAPWGAGRFVFTHYDPLNHRYYDPASGGTLSKETLARLKKGQIKYHKVIEAPHADRRQVPTRTH